MLSQGLDYLAMILSKQKKREKNKNEIKKDPIDIMESNDFTYKEYDD